MSVLELTATTQHLKSLWQALDTVPDTIPFDPLFLFLVSKVSFFCGLAYTSPSSPIRFLLFIVIAIAGLAALRSPNIYFFPGAVACDYIVGVIFHASNFLLLAKRHPPPGANRERWAFREIFGARWAVKHYPPFDLKNKNYVPSRSKLFWSRLVDFSVCFSIAMMFEKYHLPWQYYANPGGFLSRWSEVSQQELGVRLFLMLKGLVIPYFGLRAGHSISTCVALLFGADPADWPPLYGSVKEAYTVRRFYSHFWHHAMRSALTSHGALLTYWLVCIKHRLCKMFGFSSNLSQSLRSPLARYLTTTFSFLASAIMHIFTCPGMELHMTIPELWVHLGTASAVVVEDIVMAIFKSLSSRTSRPSQRENQLVSSQPANTLAETTAFVVSQRNTTRHRKRPQSEKKMRRLSEEWYQKEKSTKSIISLPYRTVGYLWVVCFFTWAISNLMFALYNNE